VFFRRLVVFIVTIALIVFWSIPTAFAVSIANVSTLSNIKAFQWLEWISSYPILKGFVEGYFPVLVIFIFFQLGLLLLRLLTSYEGHISRTGEDKSALGKFFAFLLINVFLISLLAGSVIGIWNQVEQIAQNSGYLLNLLAAKIPPQVNFFINYIATVAVLRQLMNLLRPLDLLIYLCATKTSHPRSRHARHRLRSPPELDFADVMATDLLVFAITITYSSISALILLFGLLYFAFAVVSMKYNLIYVYRQRHQGLGKMWPVLFTCCMLSLLIYQATLLGMFIVNSFGIGVVIAGACFCATIVFWVVLHRKFFRISKYAPLDRVQPVVLFHAGDPDDQLIVNAEGAIDLETAYIDPVLKAPRRHSRSSGAPQSPDTDKDDSDLDDHPDAAAEDIIERSEEHPDGLIA
jgi:calcium permeable stress-gated cation channel